MRQKNHYAVVARKRGETAYREIAAAPDEDAAIERAEKLRTGFEYVTVLDRTDDPRPVMHYRDFDLSPTTENLAFTSGAKTHGA